MSNNLASERERAHAVYVVEIAQDNAPPFLLFGKCSPREAATRIWINALQRTRFIPPPAVEPVRITSL